jgi:hypothetical protein
VKRNPKEPKPPTKGAFKKVNHLVPKSAGGCTISNNNLQPHDLLCKTCKGIDDYMTEHWQG